MRDQELGDVWDRYATRSPGLDPRRRQGVGEAGGLGANPDTGAAVAVDDRHLVGDKPRLSAPGSAAGSTSCVRRWTLASSPASGDYQAATGGPWAKASATGA